MKRAKKQVLSDLRQVLVEVLAEAEAPFQLVLAAAECICLDARIDNWFLRELKSSGSDGEIVAVLEATERCALQCANSWTAYRHGEAAMSDVLSAVEATRKELAKILPGEYCRRG